MCHSIHSVLRVGKMSESAAARITQLERRIADLWARLPRHSIPPAMLIELEELEEALEQARAEAAQEGDR
jgi:hypothetical protein